ncbi:hypothetical protein Y032_0010g910 [Ancylostoma ceylanicum]|uniref:C-type lectin domain-containing protein n=1 Tax=Ancylostoma ceylanicum TaxID=53326 RepID=A0A016VIV7_9BILA|nr:hypothetical protein Y032_0010g910 [Ancylostoma ceylanicum]
MIGLILLVYLAVCAHALTIIPEFPHKHKGFRYSLLFQDTKADFATAKKICQRYGAQLVSFHGADEVEFVKQVERSNLTWMEDTWMGLTVTVTPTGFVYKWVDGTRFDFKNFAPGEPRRLESGQYCAQIIYANETEHFGKWKIVSCSDQLQPYTCKKPLDGTSWGTPAPSDEDDDFPHRFKQNQYAVEYDPNKVKFVEARIKCQNMNADLASLHSRDEVEFLKRIMQSNSTLMEDAWIGMVYTISATSAEKKWTDGSPFDYKNFAPGMPNSFSVGEHCGQVMSDGENLGKWKTTDCSDDAHIYVCKKPWIPPSVPSGDPMFPHVFKDSKFGIFNDKVTFIQARMKCEEMGAELASIHSKREIEFLKGVMQSRSVYMEDSWIGMIHTVTHTGATSRWVDSTPFDFKNFAPNEPKYQKYGDLCGQMMSNGDELSKWRVVDCTDTAYAYVCKKPKNGRGGGRGRTVIPNNPDPGSQEDGPTPRPDPSKDGFPYRFKGDKYAVNYDPNKVKFVEARVRCQNMNGELASFHSKDEIDFVKSIMQSNSTVMEDAWIGLVYDVTATGTNTKWLDGSRYDFTNYAIGEPKYDGTGQFCGQIVTNGAEFSKWKVVDCSSDAYVYVCKKTKSDNNNGGGKTKKPKVPQVVTPAPEPENPTVATPPDSKDDPFIHQFEDDKYAVSSSKVM